MWAAGRRRPRERPLLATAHASVQLERARVPEFREQFCEPRDGMTYADVIATMRERSGSVALRTSRPMSFFKRAVLPAVLLASLFALSRELRAGQQPYRPNAIPHDAPVTKEGWWIRGNDT